MLWEAYYAMSGCADQHSQHNLEIDYTQLEVWRSGFPRFTNH